MDRLVIGVVSSNTRLGGSLMFGKALRMLRRSYDIDQADLASRLGVSRSYVSEIENGNRIPSMTLLGKYADEFNIPVSSLMFFAEALSPDGNQRSNLKKARGIVAKKVITLLALLDEEET